MISKASIVDLCNRIVANVHPERIILFGSYAQGTAGHDSDVDLLIILRFKGKGMAKAREILSAVHPQFAVDLLVRTPEEVEQRLEWNDFFLRDIIDHGEVLYEAAHT